LLPWFGSEWLLDVSKNKVCLKGMKISGYGRHPSKKCDDGTESCSTTGVPEMFPTVGGSCSREYFEGDLSVSCKYTRLWANDLSCHTCHSLPVLAAEPVYTKGRHWAWSWAISIHLPSM
jgi:hypothetical protein